MAAFCSGCGKELSAGARFCPGCGKAVFSAIGSIPGGGTGYLLRPRTERKIAGVCAAFARAYGWDLTTVRIIAIILAVVTAPLSEFAYIAAWALIPEEAFTPFVQANPPRAQTAPAQHTTMNGNDTH